MVLAGLGVAGLVGLTAAATVPWQRREARVAEPVRVAEPAAEAQPGGFAAGGMPAPPLPPRGVEIPVEAPPQGVPVIAQVADPPQESPPLGGIAPVVRAEVPAEPVKEQPVAGRPMPKLSLVVAGADLGDAAPVEPFDLPRMPEPPVEEPRMGAVALPVPVPVVVAEAAPASPPAASAQALDPALVAALMRRGAGLMELGDISAARLAFGRAAAAGEAAAATALGRTYDPGFLNEIGGRGIAGDTAEAARWYRQGREMGDPEAEEALARLGAR
jgi:hypothetical protein